MAEFLLSPRLYGGTTALSDHPNLLRPPPPSDFSTPLGRVRRIWTPNASERNINLDQPMRQHSSNGDAVYFVNDSADGQESISTTLAVSVSKKAFRMQVGTVIRFGRSDYQYQTTYGQGGLLLTEHGYIFVTARHTTCFYPKDGDEPLMAPEQGRCQHAVNDSFDFSLHVTDFRRDVRDITEEEQVIAEGKSWAYGRDIAISHSFVDPRLVTSSDEKEHLRSNIESWSFEPVTNTVDYESLRGARVGIAVFMTQNGYKEIIDEGALSSDDTNKFQQCYGAFDRTQIFQGTITETYEDFFEHSINTVKGFSGAVIFLLDMNQPDSVSEELYGKAIGIHVGGSTHDTSTNLALLEKLRESETQPRCWKLAIISIQMNTPRIISSRFLSLSFLLIVSREIVKDYVEN